MSPQQKLVMKGIVGVLLIAVAVMQILFPADDTISYISLALIGYGLGSIPFGLLITKVMVGKDVRDIGSKNIGATNVLRTGNKLAAALTLLGDMLKGLVAVQVLAHFLHGQPYYLLLLAITPIIGHLFPIWLDFKGGKGVATVLGVLLALSWQVAVLALLTWFLVVWMWRYSSLGAIIAAASVPIYALLISGRPLAIFGGVLSLLVIMRHKDNIVRLINGEESKVGRRAS
ncbi:MAG: glycerol-3-phosphate 1-O-acyltransferase PlsY [Alphaproteobacteria bacterium]